MFVPLLLLLCVPPPAKLDRNGKLRSRVSRPSAGISILTSSAALDGLARSGAAGFPIPFAVGPASYVC